MHVVKRTVFMFGRDSPPTNWSDTSMLELKQGRVGSLSPSYHLVFIIQSAKYTVYFSYKYFT